MGIWNRAISMQFEQHTFYHLFIDLSFFEDVSPHCHVVNLSRKIGFRFYWSPHCRFDDGIEYTYFALSVLCASHLPYGNFVCFSDILLLFYEFRHFCGAIVAVYYKEVWVLRETKKENLFFWCTAVGNQIYITRYDNN